MSVSSSGLYNISGISIPKDAFVVIVRTEWNAGTVDNLEEGCNKILDEHQVTRKTITVPGAFEIPFAIKNYWDTYCHQSDKPRAFIALGCIIKGGTPHFDYVCKAVTEGILQLNILLPVPAIFGILTVDNQQQADERTGGVHGHKGEEAAITALKMITIAHSFTLHT